MSKIAVVYHSGYGHTKAQAEKVVKGASAVAGTQVKLVTSDEAIKDFGPLNEADCIIFGSPTYMGGPSAQFKAFMDAASKIWAVQGWKDKLAAGFTNSGGPSGDKSGTLMALVINAMQHPMIWVGTGILPSSMTGGPNGDEEINRLSSFMGPMAQSPHGTDKPLEADLKTAELFGKRVAEVTKRWVENVKL